MKLGIESPLVPNVDVCLKYVPEMGYDVCVVFPF